MNTKKRNIISSLFFITLLLAEAGLVAWCSIQQF